MTRSEKRVVVTGLGLATALGIEVRENWRNLLAGISGIGALSLHQSESFTLRAAGEVSASGRRKIFEAFQNSGSCAGERRTLFAFWAARSAIRDAGLGIRDGPRHRYGVISSAGIGVYRLEDVAEWINEKNAFDYHRFGKEYDKAKQDSNIKNSANRAAGLISSLFRLNGPNCTITSACAAATQAIGLAYRNVQRGTADVMVAGGADSMINAMGLSGFLLLKAATVGSGDPKRACRPFDRKRSGLVIGEGAGFVVLEERSHALRRGAKIYGEMAGYGSSLDAFKVTAPHPEGVGAQRSMVRALNDAGLNPSDIDYINAHGTGTKQNDVAETNAIKAVFKEHAPKLAISSSKSMIGHLMAAAGGAEFIYTVLSVRDDVVHPTINLTHPDPKCDLNYVPNVKQNRRVRAALSNSFGFGGQNATLAIKKHDLRNGFRNHHEALGKNEA